MSDQIYKQLLTSNGNDFFNTIEIILRTSISTLLKNIMKMSGFDNALIFAKIDDTSFTEIEEFMRHEFDVETVPNNGNIGDYLGIYTNRQEKFKLVCGHKMLLTIIKQTCQDQYKNQSVKFVDKETNQLTDPTTLLCRKIGAQMITVYNDAKKITLSPWSWPSRQVANQMADRYKANGYLEQNTEKVDQEIDFQYLTPAHHRDLLDSIVKSDYQRFISKIKNALASSLRVDGSTDRTQNHNIYVLGNIVSPDAEADTVFLGFKVPESRMIEAETLSVVDIESMDDIFSGEAIPTMPAEDYLQAIKDSVSEILPWKDLFYQLSSLVTDGESINSGDHNGLWAKLREERLACENFLMALFCIWCVPHRINLAWKNTCQANSLITDLIKEASSLSAFFHHSGQRTQKLKNISSENTEEFQKYIQYPAYFQIRWTQFTHSLLTAVLRNWKASIQYFESENEIGLLNRWLNYERIHFTSFLADVLELYKRFQMTFERDSITVFDVFSKKDKLVSKLIKLKSIPLEGGWEELFFKNLIVSGEENSLFGHTLNRNHKRQNSVETFCSLQRTNIIDSLIQFLNERLDQDRDMYECLQPLLKIDATTPHESLSKCHSVIIPDLDCNSFYREYYAAADVLTLYGNEIVTTLETLKILSTNYPDQFAVLKTALARIIAAKPHSADVERLISMKRALL